jgi:predicted RNA-binding Zn-ribbon protein involved in translation (DUF1610 family)
VNGQDDAFRIKCPSCRSEISSEATACPNCGAVLAREPGAVQREEGAAGERADTLSDEPAPIPAPALRPPSQSAGSSKELPEPSSHDPDGVAVSPPQRATEPQFGPSTAAAKRPRLRWLLVGLGVVLCAWAAYASYGLRENRNHAESWRQRSLVLQEQATGMSRLLTARTKQLNVRIDEINRLAIKLKSTQSALGRSEGDVGSLEARQRALANEKAQVEDQRAALVRTAALYRICKDDLITLLGDFANQDYTSATADISVAESSCSAADNSLGG